MIFSMESSQKLIRNFSIVAHIDHGKSTLADRLLEITGTIPKHIMREQFLDAMPLERERGITIKMQPVRMDYEYDGQKYILNLIDTPGHVDFSYEVSRALAAVEGTILLVDGTQGVQAQTLSHLEVAKAEGLAIIPAINKVDLATCRIEETKKELIDLLRVDEKNILLISGKTGQGVGELLKAIVGRIPPPTVSAGPLRALIFDSLFDPYKGVVAFVRMIDGSVSRAERISLLASKKDVEVLEVGYFKPQLVKAAKLSAGEMGYIATGIKESNIVRVGDTIGKSGFPAQALPGYREPQPVVFASLWPVDGDDYEKLRDGLWKVKLTDASLTFEPESAEALGRGFRAGFLGMLHLEIIIERLKREFSLELVVTQPSVKYIVRDPKGREEVIFRASALPEDWSKFTIEEPWVELQIISPTRFLGSISKVLQKLGGVWKETLHLGSERLRIIFEAPLREIIIDFIDRLKSVSEGYGSMNYRMLDFRKGDLVKLDFLIAGDIEKSLSLIVPKEKAFDMGRAMVGRLKTLIPKQLFTVSLQAAVAGRIIAREDISALKKDVTGYLYGGDRTRKMKLWKKQKRGKEKLKEKGRVEIPADVYLKIVQR